MHKCKGCGVAVPKPFIKHLLDEGKMLAILGTGVVTPQQFNAAAEQCMIGKEYWCQSCALEEMYKEDDKDTLQ